MKNPATPITAYVEAVEQLQDSITTFRTARESLQDASESLGRITNLHGEVAQSLGRTEKRILELLPDDFQRALFQQQKDTDELIRSLQSQFTVIEKATSAAAASFPKLEQDARGRDQAFNDRMRKDTMEVVQEFGRQTQIASTGMTNSVRLSVDALSQNVDRLVALLQSGEVLKSLTTFTSELDRSRQESLRAVDDLTSVGSGFRALLSDATGSVHASLSELTAAERAMPHWAKYVFASQIALFILVIVSMVV
jgi:hypothetical protein